jgi:signal transduction histidine kinase
MIDHTSLGPSEITPDFRVTHPLRPVANAGVLSLLLFAVSAAFAYVMFRPLLSPSQLLPLAIYVTVFVLLWAALAVTLLARRPDAEEQVRVWGPIATAIVYASHVACAWLIWGYLPHAPVVLQLAMLIPLIGHIPTQIICSPENTFAIRVGIIAVLGSAIAFLFMLGGTLHTFLALYLFGFAVVMFFLSKTVNHTVQNTVAARLTADASARELARLLEAVRAERDAKTRFIGAASHDLGQPLQAAALFFDQVMGARTDDDRRLAAEGARKAFEVLLTLGAVNRTDASVKARKLKLI